MLGKRFRRINIVRVEAAPATRAGRGGAVELRQGLLQLKVIVAYVPPRGDDRAASYRAKVRQVHDWVAAQVASTPHRVTPVVGLDLNSDLGISGGDFCDDCSVSRDNVGRHIFSGDCARVWMARHSLCALNTFHDGGWTFHGTTGTRSRIDFLVFPRAICVHECSVWRRRSLYLRASPYSIDHFILAARIDAPTPSWRDEVARARYDRYAVARCLRDGDRREQLYDAFDRGFADRADVLRKAASTPDPDENYSVFVRIVRAAVTEVFPAEPLLVDRTRVEHKRQTRGPNCIRALSLELRAARRKSIADRKACYEESLCAAHAARGAAGVHRFARLLAGRGVGVGGRDYRSLPGSRPTVEEWVNHYAQPGDAGGVLATPFEPVPCVLAVDADFWERLESVPDCGQQPELAGWEAARLDVQRFATDILRTKRGEFAPPWGLPVEPLLALLHPGRLFKPRPDLGGLGLRLPMVYPEAAQPREVLPLMCRTESQRRLWQVFAHVRRTRSAPTQANLSYTFQLDKCKGVSGPIGIRLISAFDPVWKVFYRGLLLSLGGKFRAPPWAYGGVEGRRREGLMLASRVVAWRVKRSGFSLVAKSYDVRTAFHSGVHNDLMACTRDRIACAAPDAVSAALPLFEQRRCEAGMLVDAAEGRRVFLSPEMGGLQGDSCEPECFMANYQ